MSVLAATVVVVAVQSSLLWLLPSAEVEAEAAAADRLVLLGFLGWRTVPHCASSSRHFARLLYPSLLAWTGSEPHSSIILSKLALGVVRIPIRTAGLTSLALFILLVCNRFFS